MRLMVCSASSSDALIKFKYAIWTHFKQFHIYLVGNRERRVGVQVLTGVPEH